MTLLEKKYRVNTYFNNKNIKNILNDFMTAETFDKSDNYIYTNLFLNFLKGTRNIGNILKYKGSFKIFSGTFKRNARK